MSAITQFDCIVVGGGPAGLASACALGRLGLTVALVDERSGPAAVANDLRTAALLAPSIALLENLGAWGGVSAASAPLAAIRIIDDTGGLLRAPEVVFHARELGQKHLAMNVPNAALTLALAASAQAAGVQFLAAGKATKIEVSRENACSVATADGSTFTAAFLVGSDGRNSPTRVAAGIVTRTWAYQQSALVTSFSHNRPHGDVSTELHGPAGPCTTVPLPGNASSLVWVDRPDVVTDLIAAPPEVFQQRLAKRLGGLLGEISAPGPRRQFPLSGLLADRMAAGRVALVGEAGHALPPIGAQGLNLGFADVAVLADAIGDWRSRCDGSIEGPGLIKALERYGYQRAGDVRRRAGAVDFLNRTLETGSSALHLLRGAGLHMLAAMPSARRILMAHGLEPPQPLPALMRPKGWAQG